MLTTAEVCELAQIPAPVLSRWKKAGLVTATGRRPHPVGGPALHMWDDTQARAVLLVAEVTRASKAGPCRSQVKVADQVRPMLEALDSLEWPDSGWLVVGEGGWVHAEDEHEMRKAVRAFGMARVVDLTALAELVCEPAPN